MISFGGIFLTGCDHSLTVEELASTAAEKADKRKSQSPFPRKLGLIANIFPARQKNLGAWARCARGSSAGRSDGPKAGHPAVFGLRSIAEPGFLDRLPY